MNTLPWKDTTVRTVSLQQLRNRVDQERPDLQFLHRDGIVFAFPNGDHWLCTDFGIGDGDRHATRRFARFLEQIHDFPSNTLEPHLSGMDLEIGMEIILPERAAAGPGIDPTTDFCEHGELPGCCDQCPDH
ncbi:hypothetical protein SH661x_001809 [Planctomicrobium sp. SH661]|uniref:hypothetical protein n=1 Tax=Planctomicrobium sp. SH661 TaxID=3448124 RepID=UPI003F5C8D59